MKVLPKKELSKLINSVWDSAYSNFYRDFWKEHGVVKEPIILSIEDFKKLPFLTRDTMAKVPNPSDRLYISMEDVQSLRTTSGTSGRGSLFFWRSSYPTKMWDLVPRTKSRVVLAFLPIHSFPHFSFYAREKDVQLIWGDAHNFKKAASLVVQTGITNIFVTPTVGLVLAGYLKQLNYEKKISLVMMYAEYCSQTTFKMLNKNYPNALFVNIYGSAEANGAIGISTSKCSNPIQEFHIQNDFFTEIIDSELVFTSLRYPQPFPLIRYKTGDNFEKVVGKCSCNDSSLRLKYLGRIKSDSINVGGGVLKVEEIDRIMSTLSHYIEPTFKVEVTEVIEDNIRKIKLLLFIIKRNKIKISDEALSYYVLDEFSKLRLSATMRLTDAIQGKLFSIPEIVFVKSFSWKLKNKRLVNRIH